MFDINYLGHTFIFNRDCAEEEYLCTVCNIFVFKDTVRPIEEKYYYWDENRGSYKILKFTCNELIIKNIIE